jgi:hypothetical protein
MDDGEVYLVPTDNYSRFQPKKLKAKVGNLFNGNKLLGKFTTTAVPNLAAQTRKLKT